MAYCRDNKLDGKAGHKYVSGELNSAVGIADSDRFQNTQKQRVDAWPGLQSALDGAKRNAKGFGG
jgi:hypothetical protein